MRDDAITVVYFIILTPRIKMTRRLALNYSLLTEPDSRCARLNRIPTTWGSSRIPALFTSRVIGRSGHSRPRVDDQV